MNFIDRFCRWFYGLPLWAEVDNYVYFILAAIILYFSPLDEKTYANLAVALVMALVLNGRGNNNGNKG